MHYVNGVSLQVMKNQHVCVPGIPFVVGTEIRVNSHIVGTCLADGD